jgi:Cu-processing system ATP-binding protein
MRPACLHFRSVEKHYGSVRALAGIDLEIEEGSTLALLGPNGAGKSTLFGCLLGFTRPTAGEIWSHNTPVDARTRRSFGYLAERVAVYGHRSVWENGLFFAGLRGHGPAELAAQLDRLGLSGVRDRKAREISKGMLQRLGVAIALCGRPELLVLDEPFNGLDPLLLDGLQEILREEHQRGATLLISTHTMSAVEPLATHAAVLLGGKLALSVEVDRLRAEFGAGYSLELIYHQIARQKSGEWAEAICA